MVREFLVPCGVPEKCSISLIPVDFALSIVWELNQGFYLSVANGPVTMKPNTIARLLQRWNQQHTYHQLLEPVASNSIAYGGYYSSGLTRAVTNTCEVMPFIARPRTK